MSKHERPASPQRPTEPEEAAADADREVSEAAIVERFLAAAAELFEVYDRRREEIVRELAVSDPGFDFDGQIGELRDAAAVRRLIAPLEQLKRAINLELEAVRRFRDSFDPSSPHFYDY